MNMTNLIRFASLIGLAAGCALGSAQAADTAALNEVMKLKNAGITEETIVGYIQSKHQNYQLTADDIISLKAQGVTPAVLNALLASGSTSPAPAGVSPAPASPATQPQFVYQPIIETPKPVQPAPPVIAQPAVVVRPGLVSAPALSPDAAYFYQELSPYGRWILAEDNQWYWQPTVVVNNPGWRPYWDKGRWVHTDNGWYWTSDYSWGWAAFHYGRWRLHPLHGWIWFPDRVWAPAWVTWRTGGDYCGWAPLPPSAHFDVVAGGFSFQGRHVEVNFDFGLSWNHFNFCYVREMGEQPRPHFRKDEEIRTVYQKTTIINNYAIVKADRNDTPARIINHGIDPVRVSAARGRTLEPVHIQDLRAPTSNRSHERLDPRAKTLEVYRPRLGEPPGRGGEPPGRR